MKEVASMRRRMVLLAAAMMAMSGVAQAAPIGSSADAQCLKLAIQTLGPNFKPSNYTFLGGTEGNNDFTGRATLGNDVFCGFGGDYIFTLDEGDIFLGGEDRDIFAINNGTFNGGPGDDYVFGLNDGTFYGGDGNDYVFGGPPPVDGP